MFWYILITCHTSRFSAELVPVTILRVEKMNLQVMENNNEKIIHSCIKSVIHGLNGC